jgi:acyl-CoA synthetase (NDP forming)/GNAT superfamily N-acetyltransferase
MRRRAGARRFASVLTLTPEEVTLRDGSVAELRPVGPGDRAAIRELYAELSIESRAKRFMTAAVDVDKAAALTARAADPSHLAIAAVVADRVVAVGSYDVTEPGVAEVAFAVADDAQGRGLGTLLLGAVAEAAARAGITRLEAVVLPSNAAMIQVFRDDSGFPVSLTSEPGQIRVEMPSVLTADARERFAQRERLAAVAGLSHLLCPGSVAVIGASPRRGTVAGALTRAVLASSFDGTIHLVNPGHRSIAGRRVARSVHDLEHGVELAVVSVPAPGVCGVVRDCADAGVRAVIVLSAGFAEDGEEGRRRQAELRSICRAAGMRLVGPNCIGILTTTPRGTLAATFAPERPPAGCVAIASQSGGLSLAAMHQAREHGIGISAFVSFGNGADVSSNDLLQYWEQDPAAGVVLLYLESFGNPRAFSRIARRVTRSKPVVAVKAGRTAVGARAAGSHTGAMLAASDIAVDALFRQAGVVRVETPEELLEVGGVLATQPAPRGRRVGIVSNAGGLGVLAADACSAAGLAVPELSAGVRDAIARARPQAAGTNPVDLLPDPAAATFRHVVETVAASGEVDAVLAIYAHPYAGADRRLPGVVAKLAGAAPSGLPALAVSVGGPRPAASGAPVFASPERAVRALAHAYEHEARARLPEQEPPVLSEVRSDQAAAVVADALGRGAAWLPPQAAWQLLDCCGIPRAPARVVGGARAAAAAARELGGALALKIVSPDVVHKTEAGAVRTGLVGPSAVLRAAREMRRDVLATGRAVDGFVVQRMVAGVELLIGVVQDEIFGPVVACGAGGATAELLHDVGVRLAPLTGRDASELLRELRTFPLLDGYRGAVRADVRAVEEILLRVGALADRHAEIAEIDLNPVIATPSGAVAVDVRVRARSAT